MGRLERHLGREQVQLIVEQSKVIEQVQLIVEQSKVIEQAEKANKRPKRAFEMSR